MAQLRNLQLFRNQSIFEHVSHEAAIAGFKQSSAWASMQDGEILLYSYTITGEPNKPIHSLIGVVRNNTLDIITNEGTLKEAINALDSKVSTWTYDAEGNRVANTNSVNVEIIQTDGKLKSVEVDYSNLTNVLTGLNFNHTAKNTDNTTFTIFAPKQKAGQVSEVEDGSITFDSALTGTNKAATTNYVNTAIADLDVPQVTVAEANDGIVTIYNINEVDGKIGQFTPAAVTLAKVATTGAAEDVTIADAGNLYEAENVESALAEVMSKVNAVDAAAISVEGSNAIKVEAGEGENATVKTVSLKIADGDLVLSQDTNGLKTTLTVDTKKYPTDPDAEGYVADKAGKTYIQIKGIGGKLIDETDAAAFVKDGFLASVTKDATTNELVFTWNTDAEAGKENQVTRIAISDLCDVYTADETYLHLNGYKFKHKETLTAEQTTNATGEVTVDTIETAEGTVTQIADATVELSIPKLTINKAGHITNVENQSLKLNLPVTTVTAGTGIVVNPSVKTDGNDTTYAVSLAEAKATVTNLGDDYAVALTANDAQHTRISDITVDDYGRVTAYTVTTVQENFDMGWY